MKRYFLILAAAIFICVLPLSAAAAPGVSENISPDDCSVGNTVTADIVFNADNIGAVDALFIYDAARLEFVGGENASAANGTGRIVLVAGSENLSSLTCTLTFKAKAGGQAILTVNTQKLLAFDESVLSSASGSAAISIRAENQPSPKPSVPASQTSASPVSQPSASASESSALSTERDSTPSLSADEEMQSGIAVHISGKKMMLSKKLLKDVPSGYSSSFIQYNGEKVEIAVNTASGTALAYIYENDISDGAYYVWERDTGVFSPVFSYFGEHLILPLPRVLPDELASFERTELVLDSGTAECLDMGNGYMTVYAEYNGFSDFYLYEAEEGTLQRFHEISTSSDYPTESTSIPLPEQQGVDFLAIILYSLCALSVILAIMLAAILISKKKKRGSRRRRGATHG